MNRRHTTCPVPSTWPHTLGQCHAALSSYGAQRLDATGWRELGVGSLPAASPGFRKLATGVATGWATYEARDSWGQTIADIALRQPHWFSVNHRQRITALAASRLDLYVVEDDGTPATILKRVRDGKSFAVAGTPDMHVTPAGTTLAARLAVDGGICVLLSSAVIAPEIAFALVHGAPPSGDDDWSRRLLEALLRQFAAADIDGRGTSLEPCLLPIPLRKLTRLHRALRSLEFSLDRRAVKITRHRTADGRQLLAEKRGQRWRVVVSGARPGVIERVPAGASHPIDVELMRQIGARDSDGVLRVEGPIDDLVAVCAGAAARRATRGVSVSGSR